MATDKKIVVIYHAKCSDGFGGAFAAYKKFGDKAEYIPAIHSLEPPKGLAGKEVYLVDFCYPKETTDKLSREVKSLAIIDHHISVKDVVESVPNHLFDLNHSGCVLSWKYFHPNLKIPRLLAYIEDFDLWRHSLPDAKALQSIIYVKKLNFDDFEKLMADLEDEEIFKQYVEKGKIFLEYFQYLLDQIENDAEEVEFEGHRVFVINASSVFHSHIGNRLALKKPPFAIVWYYSDGLINVSLRGDGSVDVSKIAQKYGGGGHHDAAGFKINAELPLPFKAVTKQNQ